MNEMNVNQNASQLNDAYAMPILLHYLKNKILTLNFFKFSVFFVVAVRNKSRSSCMRFKEIIILTGGK